MGERVGRQEVAILVVDIWLGEPYEERHHGAHREGEQPDQED